MRKHLIILLLLVVGSSNGLAHAQQPTIYKSKNFVIKTDLPKDKADELLKKLETMLALVSKYFAVPNRKAIECIVVADLRNWPNGSIESSGLESIRRGGGVTNMRGRIRGNRTQIQVSVFSVAKQTTVQHEAVHAYCYQAFGTCGPQWYAEGMAEMGAYWVEGKTEVTAPRYVTEYLRRSPPRSIKEIVAGKTGMVGSWQNYTWRWALCHVLANNKNYSKKFYPLGMSMLTRKKGSFSGTYGNVEKELEFEYRFFLKHVQPGFDVARCSWDWRSARKMKVGAKPKSTSVDADRGWQSLRVEVEAGATYRFSTKGDWKVNEESGRITADGDGSRHRLGLLEAVTMDDYKLEAPFALGKSGEFTARESGDLYARCRDDWSGLSNNSGRIDVTIERVK